MKRTIVIFTLMILTAISLFGANQALLFAKPSVAATEAMVTANRLYEDGQFAQAAQAYQQLADQGFADSALFFNLGNAYFKQGDYGRAILNYRRAEQLAPRDEDIAANLALARAQRVDQFEENGEEPAPTGGGITADTGIEEQQLAQFDLFRRLQIVRRNRHLAQWRQRRRSGSGRFGDLGVQRLTANDESGRDGSCQHGITVFR